MRVSRVKVSVAWLVGICVAAPAAHAQEPKIEPGPKVVARSPGFVLRDGAKVIPLKSPFEIFRLERVDGDSVGLYSSGREGDGRASDVVPLDQADAYFGEQIKANPKGAHGCQRRCTVRVRWIRVAVAIVGTISTLAPAARAEETKLDRGVYVVPRSPGFVLRDGFRVISPATPFEIYRVERVEGDRLRLHSGRGEGDGRVSEVVRIDQAEAYFTEQINAEPGAAFGRLMRCWVRAFQHDIAKARVDCDEAVRLEPKNPWAYLMRGEISGLQDDIKSALVDINKAIALNGEQAAAYVSRENAICARENTIRLSQTLNRPAAAIRMTSPHTCCEQEYGKNKVTRLARLRRSTKRFAWIPKARWPIAPEPSTTHRLNALPRLLRTRMKRCDSIPGELTPVSLVRVSPPRAVTWIGHSSTWAKRSSLLPKILKHFLPGQAASSNGTSSTRHWPMSINHCVSSPRTTWPCKHAPRSWCALEIPRRRSPIWTGASSPIPGTSTHS